MKKVMLLLLVLFITILASSCKRRCETPAFRFIDRGYGNFVTIGSTIGSTIYWTVVENSLTNEYIPDSASNVYNEPINLDSFTYPVTINAQAYKDGLRISKVGTQTFEKPENYGKEIDTMAVSPYEKGKQ